MLCAHIEINSFIFLILPKDNEACNILCNICECVPQCSTYKSTLNKHIDLTHIYKQNKIIKFYILYAKHWVELRKTLI